MFQPNLHACTGCISRHVTLPARGCRRAAVYLEPLAAPWRKVANWRLEDSKTQCIADGTRSFMSLRVELQPQDLMLFAIHHAVRGFGGARAHRLPDRIGRRYETAFRLFVQLHSGRRASAGDCPETARANGVRFPLSQK